MTAQKIFMSQEVLDALISQGKAELKVDLLTVNSRGQVYRLVPAYKFLYVVEGVADAQELVGKIFTKTELMKIKADIYMDSALVNEVAYQVEPGFMGVPEGAVAGPAAQEVLDHELLSEYLLKVW